MKLFMANIVPWVYPKKKNNVYLGYYLSSFIEVNRRERLGEGLQIFDSAVLKQDALLDCVQDEFVRVVWLRDRLRQGTQRAPEGKRGGSARSYARRRQLQHSDWSTGATELSSKLSGTRYICAHACGQDRLFHLAFESFYDTPPQLLFNEVAGFKTSSRSYLPRYGVPRHPDTIDRWAFEHKKITWIICFSVVFL